MKTIDEVIKAYEYCIDDNYRDCRGYPYGCEDGESGCSNAEEKKDALHYLKQYQSSKDELNSTRLAYLDILTDYVALKQYWAEQQENPPLTWDELKGMVGKPVWVEYNFRIDDKDFRDKSKRWCIVREFKPWRNTEIIITENGFVLSKNEQIKDWQAYRKER